MPSSQLAVINKKIATALRQALALPPSQINNPALGTFISTYSKDAALQTLQALIWETPGAASQVEQDIRKRTLALAVKIAPSVGFDIQTLLDLAIVYTKTNLSQTRSIFEAAVSLDSSIISSIASELVPAFTLLLSTTNSPGLYGLRKAVHCISSFLQAAGPSVVRCFSTSKEFILALAKLYDGGLADVAQSYGGIIALQRAESRALDDWERIWIECKVALVDSFHVIITTLLHDLSNASGSILASESERAFDILFNLIEVSSTPSSSQEQPATPFLNQSLLVDYQHSYDLSRTLGSALSHVEKDPRVDVLQSTLNSFENQVDNTQHSFTRKNPGVLRLLLRSSGIPPGIDNLGKGKGKGKALSSTALPFQPNHSSTSHADPNLDLKVTQVLDILPEHSSQYIRDLLSSRDYPFAGSAEKVVEALLEGIAPSHEQLLQSRNVVAPHAAGADEFSEYVKQRQNVFAGEHIDESQVRVGKKRCVPR